tara:strand:- start:409 stop:594 length:186 start_codon:yes stop_codon:yes gene_type:complete
MVNMLDAYDKNGEFSSLLAMETLFDEIKALRKQHEEDQMRIRVLRYAYATQKLLAEREGEA